MPAPALNDEVAFISGVAADGTLPLYAYAAWNSDTPATYTGGYTESAKWGAVTAGTPGGTIAYYFDPATAWNATEQQSFAAGLALWSAVANISFVQTANSKQHASANCFPAEQERSGSHQLLLSRRQSKPHGRKDRRDLLTANGQGDRFDRYQHRRIWSH